MLQFSQAIIIIHNSLCDVLQNIHIDALVLDIVTAANIHQIPLALQNTWRDHNRCSRN